MEAVTSLDAATLLRVHRELLRIRMIEEKIAELYPEWQMRCPVHLSIGQEATAVGVCAHLTTTDWVMSGHRSHGHYLAKGGDLKRMLAELYGKATGCTAGKGGSMHLVDLSAGFLGAVPLVGSTIPIAVGAAWGSRMRGIAHRVVVSFFGEAATEEGVFHEALNFAVLKKLPVVFVCENNFYSVYSPLAVRQPAGREVFELARGHGLSSWQGDGNDILEVYALAERAVARARAGEGPAFLEFKTYRWREHCGPFYDNDLGYRTQEEFEAWKARCPIQRFERHLRQIGILTSDRLAQLTHELEAEVRGAIRFARESPFPPAEDMAHFTYPSTPEA